MIGLVIFSFYAYCFYWSGYLRYHKVINSKTGKLYSGGDTIGILFSVVTAVFQISLVGPHMKSIHEGRIAGKLAFNFIDHIPQV